MNIKFELHDKGINIKDFNFVMMCLSFTCGCCLSIGILGNINLYFDLSKEATENLIWQMLPESITLFTMILCCICIMLILKSVIEKHGGVESYVEYLYRESHATSLEKGLEANEEQWKSDPALELYLIIKPEMCRIPRNLSNVEAIEKWYRPYLKALMEFDPERAFFPDANMTLRVAYGKVAGYEYADGEYHIPNTTVDGIIAKDNPEIYDYDIPESLRRLYAEKDYGRWGVEMNGRWTVPVCFIATNHTTGGNSGSPVLNGRGELVGLNFDRTWRSTMSDIDFDETICRNIAVDIRYVLMVVEKIGGAGYLIDELTLK
ncbi:MAG: S46 family peptidase [Alistipes sp.]|nr:S46 family peptidase [Alistipes sp.]